MLPKQFENMWLRQSLRSISFFIWSYSMQTTAKWKGHQKKAKSHLKKQLERLEKEPLDGENLQAEIDRTKAINKATKKVISVCNLLARAKYQSNNLLIGSKILPEILEE